MPNPNVLTVDTVLYSSMEPDGRLFPAGEPWPGDAWSSRPGGDPVGKSSVTAILKDLIAAQDQIEALDARLASGAHDLALIGQQRDEANNRVADLEQRALAAETASADAEKATAGYMKERDAARAELAKAKGDLAAAQELLGAAAEKVAA